MEESTSREKILKKVRKALIHKAPVDFGPVDFDSPIYTSPEDSLEIVFATKFSALNGKFLFCENKEEFVRTVSELIKVNNWTNIFCLEEPVKDLLLQTHISFSDQEKDFTAADIGFTLCECLIARTGSVLVTSRLAAGRRLPVYSNIHVVVAYTSQLVYDIKDGLNLLKTKYGNQIPSMIVNITGPSRTADIEKTLVQGAHGPKEIYVCLIDDASV